MPSGKHTLATVLFLGLCISTAHAQELITNGNFETGTFAGYTHPTQDNGNFFLLAPGSDTPAVAPDTTQFHTAANVGGGNFFAVSASGDAGVQALLQNFTVPLNVTSLKLTFQMFVNDQIDYFRVDPSGLDDTSGGTGNPNQHARVDILTGAANDLSTASGDVVDNLYLNVDNRTGPGVNDVDPTLTPEPYKSYTFDLLGVLTPGATYRLRFADVTNQGSINLGVDNISLFASVTPATPPSVPEPGSLALLAGLSLSGSLARSQASQPLNLTASSRSLLLPQRSPISCLPNSTPCKAVSNDSRPTIHN